MELWSSRLTLQKVNSMFKVRDDLIQIAVDAETNFIGFLIRVIQDKNLLQGRSSYFPIRFEYWKFTSIACDSEYVDFDENTILIGSALACIAELYELASEEQLGSSPWQTIERAALQATAVSQQEVRQYIDLLVRGNVGDAEKLLKSFYDDLVVSWLRKFTT
jgi:hypothetical protein